MTDPLAKLLIAEGVIMHQEFLVKIAGERATTPVMSPGRRFM
jgi:hypothetical protein